VVKRAFDFGLSSLALAATGIPLLLAAAAVRLTSPGPALFRQSRVGKDGKLFNIWKLRTMQMNAAQHGPLITSSDDTRITKLGRLLRRSKMDELPQLVNVWLGEMSFVGPRPEVPRYVRDYGPEDRAVLAVRPGITDEASITFRREEEVLARYADRERAYREILLPQKLTLARRYLDEQSTLRDLFLIGRTVGVVLAR
jgi:lipopolysaccharide/colanic/teichoic acid biosynthesis glycosyltransferase